MSRPTAPPAAPAADQPACALRVDAATAATWARASCGADGDNEHLRARALHLLAYAHGLLTPQEEAEEATQRAREIVREIGVETQTGPCEPSSCG